MKLKTKKVHERRLHPWEEKTRKCGRKSVRIVSRDAMKYTQTEISDHASGGLRYEAIGGCVYEKLGSSLIEAARGGRSNMKSLFTRH